MASRPRVGIVGTGFIGAVHARSALLAGARLTGVAASTPERSHAAAERLGADRAFASGEELVASDDVDVVHVCAPNALHEPLAAAALAAGKHVVCEKPLAMDAEGARRLVEQAGTTDRVAAVPFAYRFYPTVRAARERVRQGLTGAVHLVHGTYLQDWLLRPEDDNWRVDAASGGASRAFADIGSHWCDLAEFVSGHRITRLCARTTTVVPERVDAGSRPAFAAGGADGARRPVTTEDAAVLQFETDGGALGSAVVSQVSAGRKNRLWLEVDGAEEALAFDQERPEALWVGRREATTLLHRDPATMPLAALPAGHPEGYAACFDRFVEQVLHAVRTGEAPDGLPRFADGLRAARITDAVLRSAQEQRWVDVPAPEAL
jgi:predicted dehydrogenase